MKKYIFGILAITMAVGFSAFTTTAKKAHKPTAVDFYYKKTSPRQRIENSGFVNAAAEAAAFPAVPIREKSWIFDANYDANAANVSAFETTGNWSTVAADAYTSTAPIAYNTTTPDGSSYVWTMRVNDVDAVNGDNGYADGASLHEALVEIETFRVNNSNALPGMPYTLVLKSNPNNVQITSFTPSETVHQ